ncbi:hypothetical protein [Desulfovibrio subterraneus]|uniref:Uncharacterized protein n=1 Tax=Desulfovibrio subterraneus TaxID=2718620 RepID=A0A7J0BLL8_9BACT|nr:hypothetical protein [Desulfovibrio subterraneus]GFM34065.1 hypothetical protein DSM101010T_24300 [Desulfovibrio subterraneus]
MVQRYKFLPEAEEAIRACWCAMALSSEGEYVMHSDYAALLSHAKHLETRLNMATSFCVGLIREREVNIEARGEGKWCVYRGGYVLTRKGKWEYEPLPSSRTQSFYDNTRFTLEEAFERANAVIKEFRK